MNNDDQIIQGILNVERSTVRYSTPDGRYPVCKSIVGTRICERCGKDMPMMKSFWMDNVVAAKACEGVPPEQRWDVRLESGNEQA